MKIVEFTPIKYKANKELYVRHTEYRTNICGRVFLIVFNNNFQSGSFFSYSDYCFIII